MSCCMLSGNGRRQRSTNGVWWSKPDNANMTLSIWIRCLGLFGDVRKSEGVMVVFVFGGADLGS